MTDRDVRTITWQTIALYGVPVLGVSFMLNLVSFYFLKYAADVLLVAPAVVGLIFGLSKVWDAVTDPLVGTWSDRTRSAYGRRRPWMALAVVPLAFVFVAMWAPPAVLTGSGLVVWIGVAVFALYAFHTAINVPHLALGAELTKGSDDRLRIFSGRLALSMGGVFAAALMLGVLENSDNPRGAATWMALGAAAATILFVLSASAYLQEPVDHQGRGGDSSLRAIRDFGQNPHAQLLIGVVFFEQLGFAALTVTMPFVTAYVFGWPGATTVFLTTALLAMAGSIPVWLWLAPRVGQHTCWQISLWARAAAFAALFFAGPGDWLQVIVLVGIVGFMFGGGEFLGRTVQADVIDDDEGRTGERKEGAFFAAWNFSEKAAAGVAIFLSGVVLQMTGFEPNTDQSTLTLFGIRAGLPVIAYLIAGVLLAQLALYRIADKKRGPEGPLGVER